MRDTFLWRLCQKECARIDCDTKYEWISNMKITKTQLKQIIKEEISEVINENITDDEGNKIAQGDHLEIVDSDAGLLVLNLGQNPRYTDHGGEQSKYDTRMLVRVLNIRDPRA